MAVLASLILLLLAALAFVFVMLVARRSPLPVAEAGTRLGRPAPGPSRLARWRARLRLDRSFDRMLAQMRSVVPGRRYAYAAPWYLLIGDAGSAKTALLDALERTTATGVAPLERIAHPGICTLRFFDGGVVIDLDEAISEPSDGSIAETEGWVDLLRLLRDLRPLRPLDGVIVAIACDDLLPGDASRQDRLAAKAENLYRRLWSIQAYLGLRLPVYLTLTKGDQVPGFASFARALMPLHGDEMVGWSNPAPLDRPLPPQAAAIAVAEIGGRLRQIHLDLAADCEDAAEGDGLFVFPGAVSALSQSTQQLLNSLFRPSAYHEPFFLRGVYLTGEPAGVPQGTPGQVDGGEPLRIVAGERRGTPRLPIFVHDLFTRKVFAESALAAVTRHGPTRRARNVRLVQAALALFIVFAVTGVTVEGIRLSDAIDRKVTPAVQAVDAGLGHMREGAAGFTRASGQLPGAKAFLYTLSNLDLRSLQSPLLPSSWFSDLEDATIDYLGNGFQQVLLPLIRRQLEERVQAALAAASRPAAALEPAYALSASALQNYIAELTQLAADADQFNELNNSHSLHAIADLSHDLLGIRVGSRFFESSELYHEALRRSEVRPFDFSALIPRAQDGAMALFRPIEAQFSDTGPVVMPFTALAAAFLDLEQANAAAGDADAKALLGLLARTQRILADPNIEWVNSLNAGEIPGLSGVFSAMAQSPVFGPEAAAALRARADADLVQLQKRLASIEVAGIGPLLGENNGRVALRFAPPVADLAQRLPEMFRYPFMAPQRSRGAGLPQTPGQVRWDIDRLNAALAYYRDYEQFEARDLEAMPPVLVKPLDALARLRLDAAMMTAVLDAAKPGANLAGATGFDDGGSVFENADNFRRAAPILSDILTVFDELGFSGSYDQLHALAQAEAYDLLERLSGIVARERLYLPQRGFAGLSGNATALAVGYTLYSDVEAAQYLDAQRQRMIQLAQAAEPAVTLLGRADMRSSTPMPLIGEWRGIIIALQQYANANPSGSLTALENFIRFDLARATDLNCPIGSYAAAPPADFFADRLQMLRWQLASVCGNVTSTAAIGDYDRLAALFNQQLAGRYPFATAGAPPVEIANLARFFDAFSVEEKPVRASLAKSPALPGTAAAVGFLDQLDAVRAFFTPLLAPPVGNRGGGYDLRVAFRVNRGHERGADEIIAWSLDVGNTIASGDNAGASWFPDEPVTLRLRWAKNSPMLPYARGDDPAVDERTAIFHFAGPWSLLHLLIGHLAPPADIDPGSPDALPNLLKFTIPTSIAGQRSAAPTAPHDVVVAYIRIMLMAPGAVGPKAAPLILPQFPVEAPDLTQPAPVALMGAPAAAVARGTMR